MPCNEIATMVQGHCQDIALLVNSKNYDRANHLSILPPFFANPVHTGVVKLGDRPLAKFWIRLSG